MIRIIKNITPACWSMYLVSGLFFHKGLEIGWQWREHHHFEFGFRLNFAGSDHAGLKFHVELGRLLFEFNITDHRHWDYKNDRWLEPGEEEFYDEGLHAPRE